MSYDRVISFRPDTASNWATNNPVLSQGEGAIETDTGYLKLGDGTSTYNNLPYLTPIVDTYDLTSANATHTFPKVQMKGQVCDVFWTNGGTYTLSFAVSNSETIGGETASTWKGEGEGHIRVISDGTNWQVVEYDDYRNLGNGKWWEKRRDGMIVLYTWDYIQGDGASTSLNKEVLFSGLFPYTSIVAVEGEILGMSSTAPTVRKDFDNGTAPNQGMHIGFGITDTTKYRVHLFDITSTALDGSTYWGANIRIYGTWK